MALGTRTLQGVTGLFALGAAAVATNLVLLQPSGGDARASRFGVSAQSGIETAAIIAAEMAEADPMAAIAPPAIRQRLVVAPPVADDRDTIRAIQEALNAKGYATGGTDGIAGPVTQAAILAYEMDQGLMLTAEPSERLLHMIMRGPVSPADRAGLASATPGRKAEALIRRVQDSLRTLGYGPRDADGRLSAATVAAIRSFERQNGLPDTGRISGDLVARLFGVMRSASAGELR